MMMMCRRYVKLVNAGMEKAELIIKVGRQVALVTECIHDNLLWCTYIYHLWRACLECGSFLTHAVLNIIALPLDIQYSCV